MARRLWGWAAGLALLAPAPAAAEGVTVTLAPGEMVYFSQLEDGALGSPQHGAPVALEGHDAARAAVIASGQYDWASGPNAAMLSNEQLGTPAAPPPAERQLVIRFLVGTSPGRRLLVLENGTGTTVRYRARISVAGKTRSTDVCTVPPHLRGYEEWPEPIERITLEDISLDPAAPSDRPICE